jgi:hypothetical protein
MSFNQDPQARMINKQFTFTNFLRKMMMETDCMSSEVRIACCSRIIAKSAEKIMANAGQIH